MTWLTQQNLVKNTVVTRWFLFFTKMMPFWIFLEIKINLANPLTRSKPGTRALDWAGFKNYTLNKSCCSSLRFKAAGLQSDKMCVRKNLEDTNVWEEKPLDRKKDKKISSGPAAQKETYTKRNA